MRSLVVVTLLLVAACGEHSTETSSSTTPSEPEHEAETNEREAAGDPAAESRPDPTACESDADCVMGPGVAESNECCDTGFASGHYSRAYVAWRTAWLEGNCDVEDRAGGSRCSCCPVPDGNNAPSPQWPCSYEARCVDGQCGGNCGP